MTGSRDFFTNMTKGRRDVHVELGDKAKYVVEGTGSIEFQMDSGGIMEVNEVLYVLGLEKNLLLVLVIEDRGLEVCFTGDEVDVGPKGTDFNKKRVIGKRERDLYLLRGQLVKALIPKSDNQSEIWHRRMEHLHYKALPMVQRMVTRFPKIRMEQDGVCKGCALVPRFLEARINKELIAPYNSQQNGIAKRKIRIIMEAARAMIYDQEMPMFLWAEACNTNVYVQKRSPHRVLEDVTPEMLFTGVKPNVSHLRIFGSLVYVHVPTKKRTKLEPLFERGVFVGYSEVLKAY
eukprot:PITA_24505